MLFIVFGVVVLCSNHNVMDESKQQNTTTEGKEEVVVKVKVILEPSNRRSSKLAILGGFRRLFGD